MTANPPDPRASALIDLLRASLAETRAEGYARETLESLLPLAETHAVTPLLYAPLSPLPEPPEGPWARLRQRTEACVRQFYKLLFLTRRYAVLLVGAGIPVMVLKGPGAAAAYPVPEYRTSGDIDLLLLRKRDLEAALAALRSAGAVLHAEQHAGHHISLHLPEGVELELHTALTEDVNDRRTNAMLASLSEMAEGMVKEREVFPGVRLPLPEPGFMAVTLLLHTLHHYLRDGFGLKLLCDWTAFWRQPIPPEQLRFYLETVDRCGLRGFSQTLTRACVRRLGLPETRAAMLLEGASDKDLTDALMAEVLAYGSAGEGRMVALRGSSPAAYLREFHHQMRLNHPRSGRCPLLWPGLWLLTLLRFLRNNRVLRRVSLGSVLKSAGERGRLSREMDLFRR